MQKNIKHETQPLSPADNNIISLEMSNFCYIGKYK